MSVRSATENTESATASATLAATAATKAMEFHWALPDLSQALSICRCHGSLNWISSLSVGCVAPGSICFSGAAVVVAVVDVGFPVVDVVVGQFELKS